MPPYPIGVKNCQELTKVKRAETVAIARAWKNPQYSTVEELADVVHGMENAVFEPLKRDSGTVSNRFLIVGANSGRFYGWCTDKYRILQNEQAFGSLVNLLRAENIPVKGSMISPRPGEFRLVLVLGDEYQASDSPYKFVVQAVNSYNGGVSWGGLSAWIRAICENGMVSMKGLCGEIHHRHVMDESKREEQWHSFIDYSAHRVDGLEAVIQNASAQPVHNLEAVLLGAGFGPRIAQDIIENMDVLVPEQIGRPITQWDAFNGLTKRFSNRTKGNYNTNMELLAQASRMLEHSVQELETVGLPLIKVVATP
jgi:hypothetical protein